MVLDTLQNLLNQTGFATLEWGNYVMILVALVFMYLAIAKGFEPLLLVPISFGMLLSNFLFSCFSLLFFISSSYYCFRSFCFFCF